MNRLLICGGENPPRFTRSGVKVGAINSRILPRCEVAGKCQIATRHTTDGLFQVGLCSLSSLIIGSSFGGRLVVMDVWPSLVPASEMFGITGAMIVDRQMIPWLERDKKYDSDNEEVGI